MILQYIGAHGSMGLVKFRTYKVDIYAEGPYVWADWGVNRCPYSSLQTLAQNWRL